MTFEETIKIATTILLSLGGGGIIVFALSSWLGKVWANRIMAEERAKYERELTELRAKLEMENQESLSKIQTDLEIYRDKYLKAHNDKMGTYGFVFGVVSELLADVDLIRRGKKPEGDALDRFNRGRLKAHGHLAMLAPQSVMDAYDSLIDYIFSVLEQPVQTVNHEHWKEIRRLAYDVINLIREDVGIDKSKVEYRGKR
jgi:hypothetical protein